MFVLTLVQSHTYVDIA